MAVKLSKSKDWRKRSCAKRPQTIKPQPLRRTDPMLGDMCDAASAVQAGRLTRHAVKVCGIVYFFEDTYLSTILMAVARNTRSRPAVSSRAHCVG